MMFTPVAALFGFAEQNFGRKKVQIGSGKEQW
jgi:hypothetical protein